MTLTDTLRSRIASLPCFDAPAGIEPLGGGITNINVTVEDGDRKYVVRVGSDIPEHGILRWNELSIARAAAACGLSPKVRHAEPDIMVIDYVDAEPLEEADLHDETTLRDTTALIRRVHDEVTQQLHGPVLAFNVFHVLNTYAAFLRDRKSTHIPLIPDLMNDAARLKSAVGPVDLVLGHNDLLPANILRGKNGIWLVDWEYGGFNSPLFDLGGLATNADLPRDAELILLTTYFGTEPDTGLLHRYDAMKCASLLRETMWSMVSEITSEIEFDYSEYSAKNLERFRTALTDFNANGDRT
ncbi:phosphotransferase [Amaricoccus tamworthensis]|uniref:phosphotransferase n=1 Tax=Amaricoccus tamworthensis TaxID=57002 RepID=UPI003C7EAD54